MICSGAQNNTRSVGRSLRMAPDKLLASGPQREKVPRNAFLAAQLFAAFDLSQICASVVWAIDFCIGGSCRIRYRGRFLRDRLLFQPNCRRFAVLNFHCRFGRSVLRH